MSGILGYFRDQTPRATEDYDTFVNTLVDLTELGEIVSVELHLRNGESLFLKGDLEGIGLVGKWDWEIPGGDVEHITGNLQDDGISEYIDNHIMKEDILKMIWDGDVVSINVFRAFGNGDFPKPLPSMEIAEFPFSRTYYLDPTRVLAGQAASSTESVGAPERRSARPAERRSAPFEQSESSETVLCRGGSGKF